MSYILKNINDDIKDYIISNDMLYEKFTKMTDIERVLAFIENTLKNACEHFLKANAKIFDDPNAEIAVIRNGKYFIIKSKVNDRVTALKQLAKILNTKIDYSNTGYTVKAIYDPRSSKSIVGNILLDITDTESNESDTYRILLKDIRRKTNAGKDFEYSVTDMDNDNFKYVLAQLAQAGIVNPNEIKEVKCVGGNNSVIKWPLEKFFDYQEKNVLKREDIADVVIITNDGTSIPLSLKDFGKGGVFIANVGIIGKTGGGEDKIDSFLKKICNKAMPKKYIGELTKSLTSDYRMPEGNDILTRDMISKEALANCVRNSFRCGYYLVKKTKKGSISVTDAMEPLKIDPKKITVLDVSAPNKSHKGFFIHFTCTTPVGDIAEFRLNIRDRSGKYTLIAMDLNLLKYAEFFPKV